MSVLTLFLEPVALVGWAILVGSLTAAWRFGVRRSAWPWASALAVYGLFATPLGANTLVAPLERRAATEASSCRLPPAGAMIVVLAGGLDAAGKEDPAERLQQDSIRRVLHGVSLAAASESSRLMLSGGSGGENAESEVLGSVAAQLGIARARLIIDGTSRNTHESAVSVRAAAAALSPQGVVLVTSAVHAPRALAEFRAAGMRVCLQPTDFRYVAPDWPGYLIPQVSALDKSTAAVHEYLGLLRFFALRTHGRQ